MERNVGAISYGACGTRSSDPPHHESHEEDRSRTARPEECHRRRGGNEARRLLCRGEGVWVGREAGVGDEGFGGEAHGGSEG